MEMPRQVYPRLVSQYPMLMMRQPLHQIAVFTVEENQTSVGTAEASDPEDDTLTYSISGNELQIDSSTGVITFVSAPDFETKDEYTATVTVSDASLNDSQEIIVNITDVDDTPPVITTSSIQQLL